MNRNVESHFAQLPHANIQRSIFDRSSTHKTSFNAGDLIPIYVDEVLPGDSFKMTTSKVVRAQTMLTPILDNMYLDTYFFFVPNRIVWDHWKEFMGENTDSAWIPEVEYPMPVIVPPEGGFDTGTIADYMGLPIKVEWNSDAECAPTALPFRCYAKICEDWFRDENVTDPLNIPTGDTNQTGSNGTDYINDVANGGAPFKVARYHDYFSSALPNAQKGPAVTLPMSAKLPSFTVPGQTIDGRYTPVGVRDAMATGWLEDPTKTYDITDYFPRSSEDWEGYLGLGMSVNNGFGFAVTRDSNGKLQVVSGNALSGQNTVDPDTEHVTGVNLAGWPSAATAAYYPNNLWSYNPAFDTPDVVIPDMYTTGSQVTINELRLAFQLQKFYEKQARGGSRYIEILRQHFGVTSPDARLQRSEYLGGNRIVIQVHEVTNNAQSESDFLGDLGAKSRTADVHQDFEKSFTEHGWIIGCCCVRYDNSFSQGLDRMWMRKKFYDYYWPVFSALGERPIYDAELYADADTMNDGSVFGYQEAWSEYRYKNNRISGEMRPGISNSLASWHLADYYTEKPVLSDSWMRVDKSNVDRCLAVTSAVSNQFFGDFYFKCICTRAMPMYSIPGLIDHF